MLSKSQAKIFFLGGTGVFTAAFLALTFDTHRKVPAQTRQANITPAVDRGKHIWEDNNCMGCHTLFGEGAYYAPELTKAVERRGKPWLKMFLKDPEAMFPNDRKMVNYHFNDAQIEDVIAFLEWCGNVDLNGFPAKPPLAEKMKATSAAPVVTTKPVPAIFDMMACRGCHSLGGQGGMAGAALGAPPLDDVYKRKNKAELAAWISDPAKVKPDTKMPKIPLTPAQLEEIVTFLSSLGN
ncbi:MAG: c-type cytochrome [Verrucomicrobiaceae bacterium]|nr:c-type cytochrome [Verrucomicrobiaceae bacterium]